MFENWFEQMYHEVENPYMWLLIFAISLRGVYSNVTKKDYGFAAAFLFVAIVSGIFGGIGLGILPHSILETIFQK